MFKVYQDDIEGPNLELLTKPSTHIKPTFFNSCLVFKGI